MGSRSSRTPSPSVSRAPLAWLKILEGEGQEPHVAHRGYFVTELSLSDMWRLTAFAELLEAEAVVAGHPRC